MMLRFSKEAYYGVHSECICTKNCEPWVLAYDKHKVIQEPNGGYVVVPYPDEEGKGYFQEKAYVHRNWVIDDEQ